MSPTSVRVKVSGFCYDQCKVTSHLSAIYQQSVSMLTLNVLRAYGDTLLPQAYQVIQANQSDRNLAVWYGKPKQAEADDLLFVCFLFHLLLQLYVFIKLT